MDYGIDIAPDGLSGAMTWEPCITLANNVFLSLAVERGSFFHNPEFGLRRRERMKNTEANAALIRHDYLEALQWLKDVGRATAIEVQVQRNAAVDPYRLAVRIQVTQADGQVLSFDQFREVV